MTGPFLGSVLAMCFALSAQASSLDDTHTFHLGAYQQDIDVVGAAGRDGNPGIELDFSRALGVDDTTTTPFFEYRWRFTERWSLQAHYSQLDSSGSREAQRNFSWNGQEFEVGTKVKTEFELDTLLLGVNYAFVRTDSYEFGLGAGLHAFDIGTELSAAAQLNDLEGEVQSSSSDLLAPLPNVRAFGTLMITPRWELSASAGWLSLSVDDYDGDYLYFNVLTEYRVTDNFGIGLSYQLSDLDITKESGNKSASFEVELSGPSLFLSYGF
jgi:hypothetical protein